MNARRGAVMTGVIGGLVAALAVPLAARAAPEPITFGVDMGDSCISGKAAEETVIDFRWRDDEGATKLEIEVETGPTGNWFECFAQAASSGVAPVVEAGDRLRVNDGQHVRTFVVPRLTLNVDRVSDTIHGKAPAGTKVVVEYASGILADFTETKIVHAKANGRYVANPGFDIIGGLYGSASWKSEHRDHVRISTVSPSVTLTLGDSRFSGQGVPRPIEVVLEGPGSTAKGSATTVPFRSNAFHGRFRDDANDPTAVAAGDRLLAPELAADADWIVPGINEVANANTDHVKGRCLDSGSQGHLVEVRVTGPNGHSHAAAIGSTDEDGRFDFDFTGQPFPYFQPGDVRSGDSLSVSCMLQTGDWVKELTIVP